MLIAARSSQDFACCARAMASAQLEIRLRFCGIRLGRLERDCARNGNVEPTTAFSAFETSVRSGSFG